MLNIDLIQDWIAYRLALVSPESRWVLTETEDGNMRIPRIAIQRRTRPARQIQNAIQARWNIPVVVLDLLEDCPGSPLCIAELLSPQTPTGLFAVPVDRLDESELTSRERQLFTEICSGNQENRAPFSRLGWIYEAMAWIQRSIGHKAPFTGEIEQLNAGGAFALVRFPLLTGTSYWLKAVGAPNLHEFSITAALARICPEYLPPVIATRGDWNAWLMEDAGKSPDQDFDDAFLDRAVKAMAELQQRTSAHIESLLHAGAADQRNGVLAGHTDELVDYLDHAMQLQTSTKVPRLGANRLREIGELLKDACEAMEILRIPDTVVHNDLNCGNVLIEKTGCAFIDWCEASIGNPFLTIQHFFLLAADNRGDTEADICRLRHLYGRCWSNLLPDSCIERALDLAPLLAITTHLYGRGDLLNSIRRNDPHVQRYARTLARHMDRAARRPEFLAALN